MYRPTVNANCCPKEIVSEKKQPLFYKVIPKARCIEPGWRREKEPKEKMSRAELIQKANCNLKVKEYLKPTEKQKYLFVNDMERVGALRTTYLKNGIITEPNTGKTLMRHGYEPQLKKISYGFKTPHENGVAQCLGEWRAMTPSEDPTVYPLDHKKINKNCEILGLVSEREFNIYRKRNPILVNRNNITGRRDRTIYYPKGMTFGTQCGKCENFPEIFTHKEQKEWVKERKLLDQKICRKEMERLRKLRAHSGTYASELRITKTHEKYFPPQELPKVPTKLRQRSTAKISSFWNTDEVLKLLHDHPEFDERVKYFSVPSSDNKYYDKVNCPENLKYDIHLPSGNESLCDNHTDCKQCGALNCVCFGVKTCSENKTGRCKSAELKNDDKNAIPKHLMKDEAKTKMVHFEEK